MDTGKKEIGYGKDFLRSIVNASNVETMTNIKTDGNKCGPPWIIHRSEMSFRGSKSHLQQTNDRVRGHTRGALSAETTPFMMEEEA